MAHPDLFYIAPRQVALIKPEVQKIRFGNVLSPQGLQELLYIELKAHYVSKQTDWTTSITYRLNLDTQEVKVYPAPILTKPVIDKEEHWMIPDHTEHAIFKKVLDTL